MVENLSRTKVQKKKIGKLIFKEYKVAVYEYCFPATDWKKGHLGLSKWRWKFQNSLRIHRKKIKGLRAASYCLCCWWWVLLWWWWWTVMWTSNTVFWYMDTTRLPFTRLQRTAIILVWCQREAENGCLESFQETLLDRISESTSRRPEGRWRRSGLALWLRPWKEQWSEIGHTELPVLRTSGVSVLPWGG